MKKIFWFFFSSFIAFLGTITFAEDIGYTIRNYQVDMQLNLDGSMDVKETIDVNFTISSRGIFRELPYYNDSGRYTIIEQLKSNKDSYTSYDKTNYYAIRIWDANQYLIGDKTYNISYRVKNAIAGFGSWENARTELYRNIIGLERDTTINKVNFTLQLPKEVEFWTGEYYAIYGAKWEKKTDFSSITYNSSNRKITWSLQTHLNDREGFTIGVKFPTDYFDLTEEYLAIKSPTQDTLSIQNIRNNWISVGTDIHLNVKNILLVILVIVGGFSLFALLGVISFKDIRKVIIIWVICIWAIFIFWKFWFLIFFIIPLKKFFWKDWIGVKKSYISSKPITIYYTPPKNVDLIVAAEIYSVKNSKTFSALIYDWASKGYVSIEQKVAGFSIFTTKEYLLHKKNAPVLRPVNAIRGSSGICNLNNLQYTTYERFEKKLKKIQKETTQAYFTKEKKNFLGFIPYTSNVLSEKWIEIFEQLRGFEHYLKKVEEPYLKQILKEDPNYIDKMLPRAVLFGVETEFLKAVERIIWELKNPDRYSGTDRFSPAMIHSINSTMKSAATPPSYSGSGWGGSSGFGGWWGSSSSSSWGGWGGWGWWRW